MLYQQTIETGARALAIGPNPGVRYWIGLAMLMQRRDREALAQFKAGTVSDPLPIAGEAIVAARAGDDASAQRIVDDLQKSAGLTVSYQFAQIYAQWGRLNQAFTHLDNALRVKDPGLIYLRVDPMLAPIRGDQRFSALVKTLDFP
ncbi:TPR end-of-group domain-containing protein [Brevundimonas sp.]|uniref:TPR end-of-group domain-containing protein n=1 Tax=Brevundimonas sp. TaxID=1871086 RepID=UPI0037C07DF1